MAIPGMALAVVMTVIVVVRVVLMLMGGHAPFYRPAGRTLLPRTRRPYSPVWRLRSKVNTPSGLVGRCSTSG